MAVIVMSTGSATASQTPAGSFVTNLNRTNPLKPTAGVKVSAPGVVVADVLLRVPDPVRMDHVAFEAEPPLVAPASDIAVGLACWHFSLSVPAETVGAGEKNKVTVSCVAWQGATKPVVAVR
jgi:hypothetical protein